MLRFAPAAKLFQWHLVSRKWRHVLRSPDFQRKSTLVAAAAAAEQPERSVIACVIAPVSKLSPDDCKSKPRDERSKVLEVDLSMVPASFWSSPEWDGYMVAAANGLVCISNLAERHHLRATRERQQLLQQGAVEEEAWEPGRP